MEDCPEIIDYYRTETRVQISLAMLAEARDVAAMHIDLAQHAQEQARTVAEYCAED